jgi:hypothetical protein
MADRGLVLKLAGAAGVLALLAGGLVQAQPSPTDPATQAPPQETAPPSEEPPPAPGETTPSIVPPAEIVPPAITPPPAKTDEKAKDEDKEEAAAAPAPVDLGPPDKRRRHGAAVIQALDKITAETMRFEVKVGRPVRYKGLVFTVRACETTAPDETMEDTAAYVEVRAEPKTQTEDKPSRQVFRGWMFASTPSVAALEHPVYDAWLIACRA